MRRPVQKLSRPTYFKIAAASEADPRTVQGYFEDTRRTSHSTAHAIRSALQTLGIADPKAARRKRGGQ